MAKKQTEAANVPAFEAKLGSIRVTVWKNSNESGAVWHNVTCSRVFKQDGQWSSTDSLSGVADCALAIEAITMAKAYIISQEFEG